MFSSDSSKQQSPNHLSTRSSSDDSNKDDSLSPADLRELIDRLTREESESKEIKQSAVRKLTADMTERGRKIGAHLESIHGYTVKGCTNLEDPQDQVLSEELADELRKRTTSVDTEIKQLENQMGQLQRTLVKGKARRESLRHRMSVTSPGRKASAMSSSCSSTSEADEFTLEDYKAKIEMLENEKLEWLEDRKDLGDEIKFLKYQLQYRLEVQSLQNDNNIDKSESENLVKENEILREENCNLKERLSTITEKLKEKGNVEDNLLDIADVSNEFPSGVSSEGEIERLNNERKILLSTIMRMQSLEKDDDESPSFADFGVQVDLNNFETIEEDVVATPLVAKLTKENKALKKHITDMQKDLDDYEEERKTLSEENFKLTDEKRSLEDTINKLRTQMSDTLDTTLDEIEQLHAFNEDLEERSNRTQAKFKELLQAMSDLQSNNCKSLERLLDEVEAKVTIEDAFDYLGSEVPKLIEQNKSSLPSRESQGVQRSKEEKQFSSNLLNEVKSCKDLLESQRSHIRKLQLDKRDIEEGYTKMKRELLLLKSSKQRARENSKELQFLKKRRAKSLNDGAQEAKAVLVDKESLQREVKRLGSMKTELENTVQKMKKEKATLEDEKVCLLGSLYHQLERNESLEMQIEELSAALQQWEEKSDLENDVFGDNNNDESQEKGEENLKQSLLDRNTNGSPLDNNAIENDAKETESVDYESKELQHLSPKELDVEHVSGRPTSPVVTAIGSVAEESMYEMKAKIHALGEQLKAVQESVIDLETERDKILEDLEDSKKNEKELRNVIVQLKRENSIYEDKFSKSNELAETLQIRLKESQSTKEEALESLEEAKAEKEVSKKHSEVLDSRLKEVTDQRDHYKDKTEHYNGYLQELYGCITEMVQSDSDEIEDGSSKEADEPVKSQADLESGIYKGLGAIQTSINDVMKQLNEKNDKLNALNGQMDTSNTEREALQRSLRESDAKKKQLKGFISKLTEEKEKVNEQLDEMKQQKSNLADALENVYQSKEKLQNRLSEALCKQEQYKKSLAEAIDEAKTLRESLYRMVNEHETMKESLLTANREIEYLKSQHRLHTAKSAINVIKEEEEKELQEEEEQEKLAKEQQQEVNINQENQEQTETDENEKISTQDLDMSSMEDRKNLRDVVNQLKNSLQSLSTEHASFESEIMKLLSRSEVRKETDDIGKEEITSDDDVFETSTGFDNDKKEEEENREESLIKCVSKNRSKEQDILSLMQVQIDALEKHIEEMTTKLQSVQSESEDNEAISGLMQFQADLLKKKLDLDSKEVEDNKKLVEWFEVISAEKETLEKELENASRDNIKLLEDLATLRNEKEAMKIQLDDANKITEVEQSEALIRHEAEFVQKENYEEFMPAELQKELLHLDDKRAEGRPGLPYSLEELDAIQLRNLAEKFQLENKALNTKLSELLEKSNHFNTIEMELEKSNNETKALEKQVEVLSKEGATLRGEADERVQRLIELEENMILTIEKKLELAEYASMLTSKKDTLEKKCEELSREVEGLKESRDQILALKSQSDEEMRNELKHLKEYKERAIHEIEDLNDILKIGRQDFEAIKIELDSMQRKNRSLKQDLEKSSAREEQLTSNFQEKLSEALVLKSSDPEENPKADVELLKLKVLKLESDAIETAAKLEKEKDVVSLLTELICVYDTEVKEKIDHDQGVNDTQPEIDVKVAEVKNWIKTISVRMESYAHKTKMLDSFVQEFEDKASEVLKREVPHDVKSEIKAGDEGQSFENASYKLELLIQKLKDSFQSQTNFQTQLGQIKEDNERITKELEAKSNFLKTMRHSFEQLLQEKNLLAQRANGQQLEMEGKRVSNVINPSETSVCNYCEELVHERDELKLKIASMNEDSAELKNKCRLLKEHLLQLKRQEDNNNFPTDLAYGKEYPNSINEAVSQEILVACESIPVCESVPDVKDQTLDLSDLFQADMKDDKDRELSPAKEETPDTIYHSTNEKGVNIEDREPLVVIEETSDVLATPRNNVIAQDHMDGDGERDKEEREPSVKDETPESTSGNNVPQDHIKVDENMKEIKHEPKREPTELQKEFLHQEHELDELSKEKEERKKLISNLKTKIDDLKSISHHKEEHPKSEKDGADMEEERLQLRKMLAERSSSLKDLNEKLGVSKNFMQRILDENRDLKENVADYELELKEMKNKLEVLKAEMDLKATALLELKDAKYQLETKKTRIEDDLSSAKEQLKTRGALLATLEKDKEAFKGNLRKAQQDNASLKKQYELLQELADSGKQRQKDTEALVQKLKQSCDEMTENFERISSEKKNIQDSLNEQLQAERQKKEEYQEKVASLDKSQSSAEKTVAEYKEKVQSLTRELRRDKSRRDREISSIKQENAKLLGDEARIQKELENLREQIDYERSKNDKLEEDLKSAIIHNLTLNNSLKVQSQEKDKTSKELEGNKKESKRLNTLTGDLKSKIANLEALLKATKDEKKFFADEAEKTKAVNADLRLRLKESSEDKEELEDILVEMRDKRQNLHSEIDKALTERDELEDKLFDLRKEMTKKLQILLEGQKKAEEALEKAVKQETALIDELNQLKIVKTQAVEENNVLKDDLEKAKTELIELLQSASPHHSNETVSSENEKQQLQDAQFEVQRLNSLLEKTQKEFENLKVQLQCKQNEQLLATEKMGQQEPVQEEILTIQQTELQPSVNENNKEILHSEALIAWYKDENMRLRTDLKQVESKVTSLEDELYNSSKRQVQEDFKCEVINRKCSTLEEDLRKSNSQLLRVRTSLKASNANLTDLRRNLRAVEADKEKVEYEYKRLMLEKGAVERVKVTSMEVPAASQITGLDKDIPVVKAESLESARKEIVILEAQVKDMRERTKHDQEFVDKVLSEMDREVTRALTLLSVNMEQKDPNIEAQGTKKQQIKTNHENLQSKLLSLRKSVDALEKGPHNGHLLYALSKEDSSLFDKLGDVVSENHKLKDKLQFLQDRLNAILQEKQVLEDIGSSTRKELRSLVKSLSSEREEMKSMNTERSQMKAKIAEAEKKIEELTATVNSLEEGRGQTQHPEKEAKVIKQEVVNAVEAIPLQQEHDLQTESKHLEMELMEQDRELQWLRHECKEVKATRDELKSRCQKLESERSALEAAKKKLESQNQDLYSEIKKKERYLVSYREDNGRLLTIQKTSEAQIRHLNREIELFSDRVVCCETEKEQIEEANRQQQNEMQELFLHHAKDNIVREKLEKLFYENTKLKEQKKMLSTRLQTLERDMKSQILAVRDLETEKEEMLIKIDKTVNEKLNEISKKERLGYLLEKHEKESRAKVDSLSRLVEKLKHDKDELCAKNPRLDKIHQENNKLSKDCAYKDTVITKLKEENHSLKKENDALRLSYDKLKDSQKILSLNYDGSLERAGSFRRSPHHSHKSASKTPSFSSLDRASPASSRTSFSSERKDSRNRTPPVRRSSSRRRVEKSGDDLSGGSSQECFCSPILSVVNLCPYEVQQPDELDSSGICPVCKKRRNRKGTVKEHYV